MRYLLFAIFILAVGCVKPGGPESVLKEYVNKRFQNEVSKEDFKEYFEGEILEELENIDQKTVGDLNQINESKSKKLEIEFKRCDEDKCFLTYSISYSTAASANQMSTDVHVKVKKIAELRKFENKWKISGITDIKTYYDFSK